MALSLGVRQGSRIAFGEHELEVQSAFRSDQVVVSLDGAEDILFSNTVKANILLEVLAFEAPRSISITRLPARENTLAGSFISGTQKR